MYLISLTYDLRLLYLFREIAQPGSQESILLLHSTQNETLQRKWISTVLSKLTRKKNAQLITYYSSVIQLLLEFRLLLWM